MEKVFANLYLYFAQNFCLKNDAEKKKQKIEKKIWRREPKIFDRLPALFTSLIIYALFREILSYLMVHSITKLI